MTRENNIATTFSIAARDADSGMLGVAVASRVLAVGAFCRFVRAGVGAISSQAYLNPSLGVDGLRLLADGLSAPEALERLLAADEGRDWRQINVVDSAGRSSAYSGARTDPWSETRYGPDYALGGNLLAGPDVVADMEGRFLENAGTPFPERLMQVLEAADAAGGDRRGKQYELGMFQFAPPAADDRRSLVRHLEHHHHSRLRLARGAHCSMLLRQTICDYN